MSWRIEVFDRKRHERAGFSSGVDALDHYLKERVSAHGRQGVSRTYVAIPRDSGGTVSFSASPVQGFYTLSAAHVEYPDIPDSLRRRLPRYPMPVALLGQLAVDRSVQGQGLGGALLYDALLRVMSVAEEIGIVAVLVEARETSAAAFYAHYGFVALEDQPGRLVLPLGALR